MLYNIASSNQPLKRTMMHYEYPWTRHKHKSIVNPSRNKSSFNKPTARSQVSLQHASIIPGSFEPQNFWKFPALKKKKQQNGRSQLSSSRNIPAKAVAPGFDSSKIAILCLECHWPVEATRFFEKIVLRPISGACFKQFSTWQKGCQRRAKSSRFLWLSYFPANLLPPPIGWP